MSLEDIYNRQVQGKQVGGIPSIGSAAPPIIERDPNVRKLEQDVFARMHEIVRPEPLQEPNTATPDVEFVSFEQALRELQGSN
jgi:hypothetical protein